MTLLDSDEESPRSCLIKTQVIDNESGGKTLIVTSKFEQEEIDKYASEVPEDK